MHNRVLPPAAGNPPAMAAAPQPLRGACRSSVSGSVRPSLRAPCPLFRRWVSCLIWLGLVRRGGGEVQVAGHMEAKLRGAEFLPFRCDLAEDEPSSRIGSDSTTKSSPR